MPRVQQRQIDAALRLARQFSTKDPQVRTASYDRDADTVVLTFRDGVKLVLPRNNLQGLEHASKSELARIELVGSGTGLHWPLLDVDHYVLGLVQHVFGTQKWMSQLGHKGGSVTSPAKRKAARANGKKGGRPRKQPQVA